MAATRIPARRRRARRGSLERPVNARLYRGAFLFLSLPLLILAFSIVRPGALPAPLLPPNFDGTATRDLAADLAKVAPDRAPETAGSLTAGQWFRDHMAPYALPISSDAWQANVPGRLLSLVEELTATYGGFSVRQEGELFAAADAGVDAIDLTYEVPAAVGPAARHLEDILTEADDYCQQGRHLLTLASPPEVVAFRRWFLDQFTRQAAGEPPTPWGADAG